MWDLECNLSDFDMYKEKIGSGASSCVDLMKHRQDGTIYAVKVFHSTYEFKNFFGEIETMSTLKHPFVLGIAGFQLPNDEKKAAIVMEYAPKGSLRDLLRSGKDFNKIDVLWQIARGMKYIHAEGKMHCDLKPDNILFDSKMNVKIGDFGLARDEQHSMTMGIGTASYMAPELLETKHYTHKVDVFAFGQIMIEVLSGEELFSKDLSAMNVMNLILKRNLPPIPSSIHNPLRDIIEQCRNFDPENRPEFDEIEEVLMPMASPNVVKRGLLREFKCMGIKKLSKAYLEAVFTIRSLRKRLDEVENSKEERLYQRQVFLTEELLKSIHSNDISKAMKSIDEGADINKKDDD